jgi:hypothetical protein
LKRHYYWDRIGVHGISIGGIPACHLGNKSLVDFVFADRSFSSLEEIVSNYPLGWLLKYIYKLFLFDNTENTENYLKVNVFLIRLLLLRFSHAILKIQWSIIVLPSNQGFQGRW